MQLLARPAQPRAAWAPPFAGFARGVAVVLVVLVLAFVGLAVYVRYGPGGTELRHWLYLIPCPPGVPKPPQFA